MNAQLQKIEQAFHAALAARESGKSIDLLSICDGDESTANEVRVLLKHLDEAGSDEETGLRKPFLAPSELHADRQPSLIDGTHSESGDEWGIHAVGQRVGEFTIVGELGAGGMGVVFVAAQDSPQRTVALKLIRRAIATKTMVRRFEREAQLLGRLNHPGIAQVYAAGVADLIASEDGNRVRAPYIAMELVEGSSILEYVRRHRDQNPQLAMQLIAQVCDAIEHAHLRGVIHRDLKPANILITTQSSEPQVKVLDFGVARQSEDDPSRSGGPKSGPTHATTRITFHGHLVGTLSYMSPEQFSHERDADVRSDVYSLGAILHQLLSDQLPIDVADCSIVEAARRVTEQQPKWLGSIDPKYRGDIETIVFKALEKEPSRRYQSPAELARDLRHYLAGEPIEARRDSVMYVLRKQAARYRALAAFATLFLLVAIGVVFYARAQEAEQQRIANVAIGAQAEAESARRRADITAENLAKELSASRIAEGRLLGDSGDLVGAERLLWDELIYSAEKNRARWAIWELYVRSGCANTIAAHTNECQDVAIAPDGQTFATVGEDAFVRIWRLKDGAMIAQHESGQTNGRAVLFTRRGSELIVTGPQGASLIDTATGERRALDGAKDAYGIDVSPDGALIAIGTNDGAVRLFDRTSAKQVLLVQRDEVVSQRRRGARGVCFDSTGKQLAAAYDDGDVRLFNLSFDAAHPSATPGAELGGHPNGGAQSVRFGPEGDVLVSGGTDRSVRWWRVSDGAMIASAPTTNGTARAITFSPDGSTVAVAGYWRTAFFDAKTGASISPPGNRASLGAGGSYGVAFTPNGEYLLTAQDDGACRIWKLTGSPFLELPSTRATVRDISVARVGEAVVMATAQTDGTVRVRAAPLKDPMRSEWRDLMRTDVGDRLRSMTMTTDASLLMIGRADGHVVTLDARDGRIVQDLETHTGTVNTIRLTPDQQLMITCGTDGFARTWRRRADGAGWERASELKHEGDVIGATINAEGTVLLTTNRPTHLRFWSLKSDGSAQLVHHVQHQFTMWKPTFNRKGTRLAVGAWDRSIMLWDTTSTSQPRHLLSLMGHTQLAVNEQFDDAGRLLASVSNDGTLRIWDFYMPVDPGDSSEALIDRRRGLATLDAKAGDAMCVAYLPPKVPFDAPRGIDVGQWLIAVGYTDGSVRIWDIQYFHESIIYNDRYQRKLRGIAPTTRATMPPTTTSTTRATTAPTTVK